MPLFGPRLDRPSAVGEEGRPRSVTLGAASLVVVAYLFAVAAAGGYWSPAELLGGLPTTLLFGAGLTGAGVTLLNRDQPAPFLFGEALFLPGGTISLVAELGVLSSHGPAYGLSMVGLWLAAFATSAAWGNAVGGGEGRLSTALFQGALSVAVLFGLLLVVVLASVVGLPAWFFTVDPALTPGRVSSLSAVFVVVGFAALGVYAVARTAPLEHLVAVERRERVRQRVGQVRRVTGGVAIAGLVGWVVVGVLELAGVTGRLYATTPPLVVARRLLASAPLLVAGFAVGTVGVAVAAGFVTIGTLLRKPRERVSRLGPLVGAFVVLNLPVPVLLYGLVAAAYLDGARLLVVTLLLALLALLVLLTATTFLGSVSWIPATVSMGLVADRASSLAVASGGLLVAAVGVAAAGGSAPLVLAGVVAAAFVWDVSEFGLGLSRELGLRPETRSVEVLHVVVSAAVALLAVGLAAAVLVANSAMGTDATAVAALAGLGVVVVLSVARG